MSPDRYGEAAESSRCRDPRCTRGWLGNNPDGLPIPCLACKPHLAKTRSDVTDYAERTPSARAQQAINQAEEKQK